MTSSSLVIALSAAAALTAALPAQAQDTGSWLVRARAVHLESRNADSTGFGLSINNKWLPELDFSYFFTPNFATELVLTVPQKQTIHSSVVGADIGSFKHLPPTLTAQYHFTSLGAIRPYLGAGVNYTRLSSVEFSPAVAALGLSLKRDSWGLALQAGLDYPLGGGWVLNADLKKVQIGTTVYSKGADVGSFKVDPLLFGLGIGKRF